MQKLANLATPKTRSMPGSTKTPAPRKPDVDIKNLFNRLRGIYPHFARNFTSTQVLRNAVREWGEALYPYAQETLDEAVLVFRTNHPKFAPDVPEFVAVCKTIRARERAFREHAAAERLRESRRKRTPEELARAAQHLAQVRQIALCGGTS